MKVIYFGEEHHGRDGSFSVCRIRECVMLVWLNPDHIAVTIFLLVIHVFRGGGDNLRLCKYHFSLNFPHRF